MKIRKSFLKFLKIKILVIYIIIGCLRYFVSGMIILVLFFTVTFGSVSGLVAWGVLLFLNNLCFGTWFENFRIWDSGFDSQ